MTTSKEVENLTERENLDSKVRWDQKTEEETNKEEKTSREFVMSRNREKRKVRHNIEEVYRFLGSQVITQNLSLTSPWWILMYVLQNTVHTYPPSSPYRYRKVIFNFYRQEM